MGEPESILEQNMRKVRDEWAEPLNARIAELEAEVDRLTKELTIASGLIKRNVGTIAESLRADLIALTKPEES
jgi:hypothetical protein